MNEELYKQNIIDHYKNPHHKGRLKDSDLQAIGNNPLCGDKLSVYIKLDKDGKACDVSFDGDGCAISVASASILMDNLLGKHINEMRLITPGDVYDMLGIKVSAGRINCALLAYKALNESFKKLEIKNE